MCTLLSLNTFMINSRHALSSFDCDSAPYLLWESWQRTMAATKAERLAKVLVATQVRQRRSKDDLERQLLFICARLGLRNARYVSLLNSICYSTVKLPKDHAVRHCGRGSKGESVDMKRDPTTSMLLWERVWHYTRVSKTPLDRTQSKISSTHIHPKTGNWQPQSAVVECKKPGEEHTSNFNLRLSPAYNTFEHHDCARAKWR